MFWFPRLSWARAGEFDLSNYRTELAENLKNVTVPFSALLCPDPECKDTQHHTQLGSYYADICNACVIASWSTIPHTNDRKSSARIPGWSEYVEPLRKKSLFWHKLWCDCNRPHNGIVADCMRRSRALYHYEVRRIRKNEPRGGDYS